MPPHAAQSQLVGWSASAQLRGRSDGTSTKYQNFYWSPDGKSFRSNLEVLRHLGFSLPHASSPRARQKRQAADVQPAYKQPRRSQPTEASARPAAAPSATPCATPQPSAVAPAPAAPTAEVAPAAAQPAMAPAVAPTAAPQKRECNMCFEILDEVWAITPCYHARTCLQCIEKICSAKMRLQRKCPECRQLLKGKVRVFL